MSLFKNFPQTFAVASEPYYYFRTFKAFDMLLNSRWRYAYYFS